MCPVGLDDALAGAPQGVGFSRSERRDEPEAGRRNVAETPHSRHARTASRFRRRFRLALAPPDATTAMAARPTFWPEAAGSSANWGGERDVNGTRPETRGNGVLDCNGSLRRKEPGSDCSLRRRHDRGVSSLLDLPGAGASGSGRRRGQRNEVHGQQHRVAVVRSCRFVDTRDSIERPRLRTAQRHGRSLTEIRSRCD